MRNLFLVISLVSLSGVSLAPAFADDVSKGKAPFMTELGTGQKFFVKRHATRASASLKNSSTKSITHKTQIAPKQTY